MEDQKWCWEIRYNGDVIQSKSFTFEDEAQKEKK